MKIKKINSIEVQDWDTLVSETYGRPYNFQQQDGCQDRGVHEITVPSDEAEDFENETIPEIVNHKIMGVKFNSWLARDPKQGLESEEKGIRNEQWAIDMWWHRNFYPSIDIVANDLHAKGLLPAGKYTIIIDW